MADTAAVFDGRNPAGSDLVEVITHMQDTVAHASGLPTRLRDLDVPKEQFPAIVETAWLDGSIINNPVELTGNDCRDLLNSAW